MSNVCYSKNMDKLEEIFKLQAKLNAYSGHPLENLQDKKKIEWILILTRALQQETAELIDTTPWKWWKKQQKFDINNAKKELIDIVHFVIALAITLGMDAEELFAEYTEKNKINHDRQDNGY